MGVITIPVSKKEVSSVKEKDTKTSKTKAKTSTKTTKTKTKASGTKAEVKKTSIAAKKKTSTSKTTSRAKKILADTADKGRGYVVRSSKGHMKDLPKSRLAIDIEHNFEPEYILVKGKATLKNELLKLAHNASHVLLASDPDREGEAIAWHLADILGVNLKEKCRVRQDVFSL